MPSKNTIAQNSDLTCDLESAHNISSDKIKKAANKTKESHIWNCPTLVAGRIKTGTVFCKELSNTKVAAALTPVLGWRKSQDYQMTPDEKQL